MIRQFKKDVPVATPLIYRINSFNTPGGLTVRLTPGAGGTIKLQYQITSESSWVDGPLGVLSAPANDVVQAPIYALKFISTVSTGMVEIAQA